MEEGTSLQISGKGRPAAADTLIGDIRTLIEETRAMVAATVNAGLTLLY